ncbi:MAG: hypothetical protein WDN69_28455 [Aliidongia sp.]
MSTCSSSRIFSPSARNAIRRSRIGSQFRFACEIVVGDEKMRDPAGNIGTHDRLDVIRGTEARFAALDIDDGAEAALERTASTGVEAGVVADDAGDDLARQHRKGRGVEIRQIGQIVVDWLGRPAIDVAQQLRYPTALGLSGEERDAERLRLGQLRRRLRQHRQTAADVEATHDHGHAGVAELPPQIQRSRKLVRLDADKTAATAARRTDSRHGSSDVDHRVALVIGFDRDRDLGVRARAPRRIRRQGRRRWPGCSRGSPSGAIE